ncbi:hypothetical protein PR003_g32218 [Phytophthora rubi]|uniref:Uncharacterized protein n=1 Tax=Phytophthora rubi TaxID=129364 RepID=A0A6A3GJQ0_9STRA|nr:hypothetical protein PR001_g31323 [Phytophthora rubi]KAE8958647.1 hypothetical protein PR002_g30803 [Phytophthora rubi]KAE9266169.1 hypothetical protein PR003_g32218 [Phytophthora rubi]
MVKHLFDSLIEAKSYIQERLGYARLEEMKEFTEMPFLTEFMKFSSASLYVDPRCNAFPPLVGELIRQRLQPLLQAQIFSLYEEVNSRYYCYGPEGASDMNAMVIFFGCNIDDGLTRFLNARGDAFFIGATAEHQPVTSNILYGAAHFLRDAMTCYSDDEMTEEKRNETFAMWSSQYSRGAWQPASGNGGVDLYDTNPFHRVVGWLIVDHRSGKNFQ